MSRILEAEIQALISDLAEAIEEDSNEENVSNALPEDIKKQYIDSNKSVKEHLSSALNKLIETRQHMVVEAEKLTSKDQKAELVKFVERAVKASEEFDADNKVDAITDEVIEVADGLDNGWAYLMSYTNSFTEKLIELDEKEKELPDNVIKFPTERIRK